MGILALTLTLLFTCVVWAAPVVPARTDTLSPVKPDDVVVKGYVGNRLERNLLGILMQKDEKALLDGFRNRTVGGHPWIGEHVGKWLDGASRMYQYSGNTEMLDKLKRVAHGLIDTQLEDGYMGTYGEPERWTRWDVWVHKYNLLGLGAYYDATGDDRALDACRKMADLIISKFGPGKKDILKAGFHQGMAATSILEPFLRLYMRTGEQRYLAFAEYIVESLEHKDGPKIVSTLLKEQSVLKVANAKAYEMISNILGLLAMYRIKGNEEFLQAAEIAFDDIVTNRAYLAGGVSYGEAFQEKDYFPNAGHVAETCVVMSQIQLYLELLQLTGKCKYGNAMEHLIFNHLLSCQHPSGNSICYYNPLWGRKFYMTSLDCCISSGPRAIAMIPSTYYLRGKDKIVVNMLGASELKTELPNGETPRIIQETDYPFAEVVNIHAQAPKGIGYTLVIRIPPSDVPARMVVSGQVIESKLTPGQYVEVKVDGPKVEIMLDLGYQWKIIKGTGVNDGLFALQHGPALFAYDQEANKDLKNSIFSDYQMNLLKLNPKLEHHDGTWTAQVIGHPLSPFPYESYTLLPYMDAGENGYFSVWLRDRDRASKKEISMFTQAHEYTSRRGSQTGSIADNSAETFASTDTGEKRDQDYFEVNAGWPCEFNSVIFYHGKSMPNGGWFDTSKGKPQVLLKKWDKLEVVAVIEDYPDTTAEDPGGLKDGQAFRVVIPKEKRDNAHGVRITGAPAHGNDPGRNFATCGDIQVFFYPETSKIKDQPMKYQVRRLTEPMTIDADWNKRVWQKVAPLELTHFMGDRPKHFPKTQAKLLYDEQFIYVIFHVQDRYVRAVAKTHQDSVCRDSCVEFFFTPGTDVTIGYFNLEMNCGGTMLFHYQIVPRQNSTPISSSDLERIEVAGTMPKIVDPEIPESTTWTVEYRLPIDILDKYCPQVKQPAPGVVWRGNFYKCADDTSHPHWLTWSFVDNPKPDYHLPQFFGRLDFE